MLVRRSTLDDVIEELSQPRAYALDTETTGLDPWLGDRLFSLIIAHDTQAFYFNFQKYADLDADWILPRSALKKLNPVFKSPAHLWYMHNAKFDLAMLAQEGVEIAGTVHCTEALGRVERNDRFNYKLDHLAKEIGYAKSDAVMDYIKKHKLYRMITNEDGEEEKVPCFDRVPLEIIHPYGETDGLVTYRLGEHQVERIKSMQARIAPGVTGPLDILANERELTKTCFAMECAGIHVDRDFSRRAMKYEHGRMQVAMGEFKRSTGLEFVDHANTLAKAFDAVGERYPLTEKGNPSFRKEILEDFTTPIAKLVLDYRNAQKRANTYFANFLNFADSNGYIHAKIRQGGTEPGRMSYSDPNFQNLPKRKESREHEFNVRRAVIPSPGNYLAMLDYDQMEYRLMLEYAKEMFVIQQVLSGMDVHTATALMMGISDRDIAKTLNFMLLYGGGVAKLCVALFKPRLQLDVLQELVRKYLWESRLKKPELLIGLKEDDVAHDLVELKKALALQDQYFERLPGVKKFTKNVIKRAKDRGQIKNWAGRICHFRNKEYAYTAPNHLIQGGCADVVKIAMNRTAYFMRGRKSKLILQVHDELLFDMHPSETKILPEIKHIMETAYPHKHLPLTVGVDHSWKSWADKEEGLPI